MQMQIHTQLNAVRRGVPRRGNQSPGIKTLLSKCGVEAGRVAFRRIRANGRAGGVPDASIREMVRIRHHFWSLRRK